ncbi:IS21 family transposase [Halorhodospira halophila]|nr:MULTISPECIES: IS21 family transposase [Halorhodospira]MCG5529068.1 IS21 family transposase [Halorhodospira halophila]MCG5543183.1 IS21 family transposase [Halorhodospira sp. 9628]
MPTPRPSMRKIREVLRLRYELGLSRVHIAAACKIGSTTVQRILRRAKAAELHWPLPEELDDCALERLLYPSPRGPRTDIPAEPDWEYVARELTRKGVTRQQLWLEYREREPKGYGYSAFCNRLRRHLGREQPSMAQVHTAGEALYVDYAGMTVPIQDAETGRQVMAQVFVAVLGCSQLIYAEAGATQRSADWLHAHVRALTYIGGVPECIVPDNLKSAVQRPHRYDPQLNRAYAELAAAYGFAVVPARVRAPKDKALAENAVLIVEREILAPMRERRFFTLAEANAAIRERLDALNERAFTRRAGSRRQRFEELERKALKPLPQQPFEPAEWRRLRVDATYHVEHAGHSYSVPHGLIGEEIELRITTATLEVFHASLRVAAHPRHDGPGRTTLPEHMPPHHRAYAALDGAQILRWAEGIGVATGRLVRQELENGPLRRARRLAEGLQRLARHYGPQRLEAASQRALSLGVGSYTNLESILRRGLDRQSLDGERRTEATPIEHTNVRGPGYYH